MQKKVLAVAIASIIGLAGCGSDSSSSSGSTTTGTNFSGTVNKGIVSNGQVEICDVFDETGCDSDESSYYLKTTTSVDGSYDVVDAPLDRPILVLVSKATGDTATTMKCDIASCTDTENGDAVVAFGESFEVPDGWTLQAIIPAANTATTTVNVTSLTDIAAEEAIEAGGSSGVTAAIANNANQAVQEAFGITSDITQIGAVDLTDPVAVAAALIEDAEEIMAATYSASLLTASDVEKSTLITLDSNTGGYTVDTSTDGVQGVLDSAEALITTVQTEINEALEEAGEEAISLTSVSEEIAAVEPPDEVDAIPVENADEIIAAKAFVQDMRTAYNAVQDEGDLKTGLDAFSNELDVIDDLVSTDVDVIFENTSLAIEAIVDAFENAADDAANYEAANGYTVIISGDTYSINETVEDTLVVITATATEFTVVDDEDLSGCSSEDKDQPGYVCEESGTFTAEINLSLDSVVVTKAQTSLSASGTAVVEGAISNWTWSNSPLTVENGWGWSDSETEDLTIDSIGIALDANLAYVAGASAASFAGAIRLNATDITLNSDNQYEDTTTETDNSSGHGGSDTGNESFSADEMSIAFNGDITANDETLGVYLSLVADNSLGYVNHSTWSDTWQCTWTGSVDDGCSNTDESTNSEETANVYVKLHAIARVTTNLVDAENNAMAASIELKADRNAFDVVDASITIDYNGVDTILEADLGIQDNANSALTVRNTEGAVATLNALDDNADALAGTLTINGVQAGSIEETDDGLVLIRYTNGTFESLF